MSQFVCPQCRGYLNPVPTQFAYHCSRCKLTWSEIELYTMSQPKRQLIEDKPDPHPVPDGFEALTGYRAWHVMDNGMLTGQTYKEPWPPYEPFHARCVDAEETHIYNGVFVPAPVSTCTCGVYANKTDQRVAARVDFFQVQGTPVVWGTVKLWGHIIQHADGYRAEYAYPGELKCYEPELAKKVAKLYGVPCDVVDRPTPVEEDDSVASLLPLLGRVFFSPLSLQSPAVYIQSSAALKSQMRTLYNQCSNPHWIPPAPSVIHKSTWNQVQALGISRYQRKVMLGGRRGGKSAAKQAADWRKVLRGMVHLQPGETAEAKANTLTMPRQLGVVNNVT